MKMPQITKVISGQITAVSTDPVTVLTTPWMLAAGGASASIMQQVEALDGTGALKFKACYRNAAVRTDMPGSWNYGTERTAAGVYTDAVSLSGTTDQMWIQGGIAAYEAGGAAEGLARLQAQVQGDGMLIGSRTIPVGPFANSGYSVYEGVGDAFPQLGLAKLMFAIVFSAVSGTITWRPVYRQIQGDPDEPGAWSDLGASDTNTSSDGNVNTGQLTVSATSGYLFGQAGWGCPALVDTGCQVVA
ncbi:MAG: hypothetical protein H6735_15445 [Alphaproteobacteria bacterium]|nr:hypothetical protein [Alphaproteobacteria bacterium]